MMARADIGPTPVQVMSECLGTSTDAPWAGLRRVLLERGVRRAAVAECTPHDDDSALWVAIADDTVVEFRYNSRSASLESWSDLSSTWRTHEYCIAVQHAQQWLQTHEGDLRATTAGA